MGGMHDLTCLLSRKPESLQSFVFQPFVVKSARAITAKKIPTATEPNLTVINSESLPAEVKLSRKVSEIGLGGRLKM